MDLDNLKKTWQQTEIKPSITDDKIQEMLDNRGQSAFARLIKYDRLFLWLLIPCLLIGILFYRMSLGLGITYSIMIVLSFFWQRYKIRFMKEIDLSLMGILEVSKCILQYKKYIIYEMVISAIIVIPFFVFYTYYVLPDLFPRMHESDQGLSLTLFAISVATTVIICSVIYRYMYMNNIKKVQKSIKEIKDFEKDNI